MCTSLKDPVRLNPHSAGNWYEGARAYLLRPSGAKKILDWVHNNGARPQIGCCVTE